MAKTRNPQAEHKSDSNKIILHLKTEVSACVSAAD